MQIPIWRREVVFLKKPELKFHVRTFFIRHKGYVVFPCFIVVQSEPFFCQNFCIKDNLYRIVYICIFMIYNPYENG